MAQDAPRAAVPEIVTDRAAPLTAAETAGSPGAAAAADRRWWVLAVAGLAQLMVVLDATIMNIALPSAQRALVFSNADRQWVVTAYSLAFGGLFLLGGRLSDLLGRRRPFLWAWRLSPAASAVGGAATGFAMLVIARGIQGVFGAMLAPSALSILTTTFVDPPERGKAFGVYGAIAGSGGAVGLLLGGVLTEYLNWRWCLYVNVAWRGRGSSGRCGCWQPASRPRRAPGSLRVVWPWPGWWPLSTGWRRPPPAAGDMTLTLGLIVACVVLLVAFGWSVT